MYKPLWATRYGIDLTTLYIWVNIKRRLYLYYFCHWVTFSRLKNSKILKRHLFELLCRVIGPCVQLYYIVIFGRNAHTRACTLKWREKETPTMCADDRMRAINLRAKFIQRNFSHCVCFCHTWTWEFIWMQNLHSLMLYVNKWLVLGRTLSEARKYEAYCEMSDVCLHWLKIIQE
jgi:hypothetical protein